MQPTFNAISPEQEGLVRKKTRYYLELASMELRVSLHDLEVYFDLKGAMAGMYRVRRGVRQIRYNPYIFSKYFEENLESTVPHEVAHYVTDRLYGLRNIRPHGREWRQVMQLFDADPSVTHRFDLNGIPHRRHRRFTYRCKCGQHGLTTRRHNQILTHKQVYLCRSCGQKLVFAGD